MYLQLLISCYLSCPTLIFRYGLSLRHFGQITQIYITKWAPFQEFPSHFCWIYVATKQWQMPCIPWSRSAGKNSYPVRSWSICFSENTKETVWHNRINSQGWAGKENQTQILLSFMVLSHWDTSSLGATNRAKQNKRDKAKNRKRRKKGGWDKKFTGGICVCSSKRSNKHKENTQTHPADRIWTASQNRRWKETQLGHT